MQPVSGRGLPVWIRLKFDAGPTVSSACAGSARGKACSNEKDTRERTRAARSTVDESHTDSTDWASGPTTTLTPRLRRYAHATTPREEASRV